MSPQSRPQVNRRRTPPPAPTTTEILQALPIPLLWQATAGAPLHTNAAYRARWEALPDPAQLTRPEGTLLALPTTGGADRYARLQAHPAPALLQGLHLCWTADDVHDFLVDALTGLPTRQAWDLLSAAGTPAGTRPESGDGLEGTELEVTLLDLNGFKAVNDTHGHAAGDATLRLMGRLLSRVGDSGAAQAYRLGGDEFLIVRRGGPRVALEQLERDFQRAARRELGLSGLSFAAGQAVCPADGTAEHDLLTVADARMYRAKSAASAGEELRGSRRVLKRLGTPVHPWLLRSWPAGRWPLRLWPVDFTALPGAWVL